MAGGSPGPNSRTDTITQMIQTSAHRTCCSSRLAGGSIDSRHTRSPLPVGRRSGTAIVNLLTLQEGETIQAIIDTRDYETMRYLFFATAKGRVKKTRFNAYDSSLKAGLIAIKLNDDDELVESSPPTVFSTSCSRAGSARRSGSRRARFVRWAETQLVSSV